MIYDLHEMLFYSTHDMLSDAITFTSYDMTPSILSYPIYIIWIFVCHASLSGLNDLLWWNFSMYMLFSRNKYSTWIKWLPWMKWRSYMIWLSLFLCTWFFSRNQHATWMIWIYYMMIWTHFSSMYIHASFSETNMLNEWYYEHLSPLSACMCLLQKKRYWFQSWKK